MHILAFQGDSKAVWFEGGFADYIEDWRKCAGEYADKPHRIRYKALVAWSTASPASCRA